MPDLKNGLPWLPVHLIIQVTGFLLAGLQIQQKTANHLEPLLQSCKNIPLQIAKWWTLGASMYIGLKC